MSPVEYQEAIEVDDASDRSWDAESFKTDTTSILSSAFNYTYENGRRYHAFRAGKYALPNDEKEQERMDALHHAWLLSLKGKLTLAPLDREKPFRALDLGTGTGIFAIELYGDEYPNAEVIGVDLSPIQPQWVPPNVKFEVDDVEDKWTWEPESFDFIHSRNMVVGSIKDWKGYAKKIYDHLKPGGYAELKEAGGDQMFCDDGTYDEKTNPIGKYLRLLNEGFNKIGISMDPAPLGDILKEVGFVNVQVKVLRAPVGTWPKNKELKELGKWCLAQWLDAAEAYGLGVFTRVLGLDEKEAKAIIDEAVVAGTNPKLHGYWKSYVVTARKPLA